MDGEAGGFARFGSGRSSRAQEAQHRRGGVRQGTLFAMEQVEIAGHAELADFDFDEKALLHLPAGAHARDNGHAHVHLNKALNTLDRGQFDAHLEGDVVFGEELDRALPRRGFDDMRDEDLAAQVSDVHTAALCQAVPGRNDEGQLVAKNLDGGELLFLRDEGDDAEVQPVVQKFGRNVAGEGTAHGQPDLWIQAAVTCQRREQRVDRAFVDAERKLAAATGAQVVEGPLGLLAQVQHALGVIHQ